jgi:hypothetical protein
MRTEPTFTNHLLRALSPEDSHLIVSHLEPVALDRRFVLERPQALVCAGLA